MKVSFPLSSEANSNTYGTSDQTAGRGAQQRLPSDEELAEIDKARKAEEAELAKNKVKPKNPKKGDDSDEDDADPSDDDADSDGGDDVSDDEDEEDSGDGGGEPDADEEEAGDDDSGDEDAEEEDMEEEEEAEASVRKIPRGMTACVAHVDSCGFLPAKRRIPRSKAEASGAPMKIISGFPGIGKSSLYNQSPERIADSDSSQFDKSEFPDNYIVHIRSLLEEGVKDYILVSSHFEVRDELEERGFPFFLVYPERGLKEEYLQRYRDRKSPQAFVDMMDANWDKFITGCEDQEGCEHIVLKSGQYLADVFKPD